MAHILDLPIELLCIIFRQLNPSALRHCQKVCKRWYSTAHIILLARIMLFNGVHAQQFLASIDINPDVYYLNAIKTIVIRDLDDPINLDKLLFRFKNLNYVCIYDSLTLLKSFSSVQCTKLLKSCPRLRRVDVVMSNRNHQESTKVILMYRSAFVPFRRVFMSNGFRPEVSYDAESTISVKLVLHK